MRKLTGFEKIQDRWLRVLQSDLFWAIAILSLVAWGVAGCSTFEQVQQLPLDRRIELAYQSHTEVTTQVGLALDARQISVGTAKAYLELAEGSRKVLDEARALAGVDVSTAEARLQLAKDVLTRAQAELMKRDVK